jgi:hypothetical protein
MRRGLSLLGLLLVVSVVGWGYTINLLGMPNGLWNTGYSADYVYGSNGDPDAHYTWVRWTGPARDDRIASGKAYIIDRPGFPLTVWRPNIDDVAAWVSYQSGPPNVGDKAWFSYYTSFKLPTDFPFWNVEIKLRVWADNVPEFIGLYDSGGTVLDSALPALPSGIPPEGFRDIYDSGPLMLNAPGLVPGTYTLRFDVYNAEGSRFNPTGLFVLFDSARATGVPEPATYALMGTVGLALYLLRRRKAGAKS